MNRWKLICLLIALIGAGPTLVAQGGLEALKKQVAELRAAMSSQRQMFEKRIGELQAQISDTLDRQLEKRIDEIVAKKSMFYSRPKAGRTDKQFLFKTLEGGLVFTGLFRSRFEYRSANIDFTRSSKGLDDEGVRINGRFRLGFGAVLLGDKAGGPGAPQITALTEFQAVGSFANNSFVNVPGPGGVALPSAFNILTEPFEQVGLYQGYLDFEQVLADHIFIKVGRQEITFGNEFVMGNNSFFDGTVHDALLGEWLNDGVRISAFYAKEAASDNNLVTGISDFDQDEMAGAYFSWQTSEDLTLEAYALYFNARSSGTDLFVTGSTAFALDGAVTPFLQGQFWTLGTRVFFTNIGFLGGTLTLNGEAAFQTGNNNVPSSPTTTVKDQSIHGWGAEFIANWRIDQDEGVQPILTLGYYYAGGGAKNDDGGTGFPLKHIGFQPLFINRHFDIRDRNKLDVPYYPGGGRYGNMDLIPLSNIHIVKAAFSIAPSEKTEVGLAYLLAITANDEGAGTGVFGQEVDLFGSYQYSDNVQFSANVSAFFPDDTAEALSNLLFFDPTLPNRAGNDVALAVYMQALITF